MAELPWFALVESNTTGSGRQFCQVAAARGLRPVVLAHDPGRYPYLAEDGIEHVRCDSSDPAAVFAVCDKLAADPAGLAGVTSSSEYFIALAARSAERLGLPAADGAAIERARRKDLQRAVLSQAGVPVPRYVAADSEQAAVRAAARIGFPVVVKPVTGSGSVGVTLCHDADRVRQCSRELLGATRNERGLAMPSLVLVEQYVTGREFSVELFAGEVVGVLAKHLGTAPYFVETGHDFPAALPPGEERALIDTARAAVSALGVGWGATHTELRLSDAGAFVIEVNPRLAGGMIPSLLRAVTGRDVIDLAVARSTGEPPGPRQDARGSHAAIRFLLAPRDGLLTAVSGLDEASRADGVEAVQVTARLGANLATTHSFQDRIGYAIAVGPDAATAAGRARDALRLIRLEIVQPE